MSQGIVASYNPIRHPGVHREITFYKRQTETAKGVYLDVCFIKIVDQNDPTMVIDRAANEADYSLFPEEYNSFLGSRKTEDEPTTVKECTRIIKDQKAIIEDLNCKLVALEEKYNNLYNERLEVMPAIRENQTYEPYGKAGQPKLVDLQTQQINGMRFS